jgi:DNA-binding transcriptional regulator YhcF (GntR family)
MKFMRMQTSLVLALSIFANTALPLNAQASTMQEYHKSVETSETRIEKVFNKYRYEMTVEWDQQDPYFREHAQKELENSLEELKATGVSDADIAKVMEKNLLDDQAKKEYARLLTTLKKQNISEEKAAEMASAFMEKNYQRGVNFSSGGSVNYRRVMIIVGVVIVGVVTYLIIRNHMHRHSGSTTGGTTGGSTNGDNGHDGQNGNNGYGNGDQDAPGESCENNNAENSGCAA